MTEPKTSPQRDAARTEGEKADKNRKILKAKAEEGLKNADDELPNDEI
jgi:hypothetical protein